MFEIEIKSVGSSGEGIGQIDGYVVFVEGALPGEIVQCEWVLKKKKYGIGKLLKVEKASPDRVNPICPYFSKCGGCHFMHLSYQKQLEVKRQKVVDALERIGGFKDILIHPCIPSSKETHYRNKIQLPIQNNKIGLYEKRSHQIIPIDTCQIHQELGDQIYQLITPLLKDSKIDGLRHLLIKSSHHFQEALVILVTEKKTSSLKNLASAILKKSPHIRGVIQNIHDGKENVILGNNYKLLAGEDTIREKICNLEFTISPASFFQVNPKQAEVLYKTALEYANLKGEETILDAYCGVGTLSLIFAPFAKKVYGVERVPQAIVNAKKNQEINRISNIEFICEDAEKFILKSPKIDLVLMNPPRKGCETSFLEKIGKLKPKKAIYISCDPATLARDLKILCGFGYKIEQVQPVDMFPQTSHVECVVLCTRENFSDLS